MSDSLLSCPTCASQAIVKNGQTRHGKQNYKCNDCGRQFVENPQFGDHYLGFIDNVAYFIVISGFLIQWLFPVTVIEQ